MVNFFTPVAIREEKRRAEKTKRRKKGRKKKGKEGKKGKNHFFPQYVQF